MYSLVNSIVGIQAVQREFKKHRTEKELEKAMKQLQSKTVISSCYNVLYFVVAIVSSGLIHWVLQQS